MFREAQIARQYSTQNSMGGAAKFFWQKIVDNAMVMLALDGIVTKIVFKFDWSM